MRQILVASVIGVPLALAATFIVSSVFLDTFPMFRETPMDESQYLQQTYLAGLDYCENNYRNLDRLYTKNEYETCINSVKTWYAQKIET